MCCSNYLSSAIFVKGSSASVIEAVLCASHSPQAYHMHVHNMCISSILCIGRETRHRIAPNFRGATFSRFSRIGLEPRKLGAAKFSFSIA